MKIEKNVRLAEYTTFKLGGNAKYFYVVDDENDVVEAVKFASKEKIPFFVLGGGSNILISDEGYNGLVIKNEIKGIGDIGKLEGDKSIVSVGAGEDWDNFVHFTIENDLNGLENLSAIPGVVGAAPVQNIGAYGVEVSTFIYRVRAYDTHKKEFVEISNKECSFGYRNSLFKQNKDRYVIVAVDFIFDKSYKVNIDYKDLKEYFLNRDITQPSPKEVRGAVIQIRENKLPHWRDYRTAGSFFKNPIISVEHFNRLKEKYSDLPGFVQNDGNIKIQLAWILDKVCNIKEWKNEKVGVWHRQALVLMAKEGASTREVVEFANKITQEVKMLTGIDIEKEVEVVD